MAQETKYSIQEIDEMRSLVRTLLHPPPTIRSMYISPTEDDVERHLRTYMLNGTRPEELRAEMERTRRSLIQKSN